MPKRRKTAKSKPLKKAKKAGLSLNDILSNPGLHVVMDRIFKYLWLEDLAKCRLVSKNMKQNVDSSRVYLVEQLCEIRDVKKTFSDGYLDMPELIEIKFPQWLDIFEHFEKVETFDRLKKFVKFMWKYFWDFTPLFGISPLHFAASEGNLEFFELMKDLPDHCTITEGYNNTFLYCAVKNGHINVVKFLLNQKWGDVDRESTEQRLTPLAIACKNLPIGKVRIICKLFRENNADFKITNKYMQTILHLAVYNKDIKVLKYLLKNCPEIDVNAEDDQGRTLAHYVAKYGQLEKCEFLLKNRNEIGLDFDAEDADGIKPVDVAIRDGKISNRRTVKLFIDHFGVGYVIERYPHKGYDF